MNLKKSACLLLACVAASVLYGNAAEWEGLMRERRPRLPAKETRSPLTLKVAASVRNGTGADTSAAVRAAAKRALGAALPDTAVFENTFSTDEESLYVAEFTSGGARNRMAVYGQLGNFVPYYRIVDGLAASGPSDMADFLSLNCGVGGNSRVAAVDGVLAADEVEIMSGRGETLSAPYARFYFAFVDDKPGANWAHPCRYVFISEDCTSFTILYKLWRPRLSVKATGAGVGLQPVGAEPEGNVKSLEEAKTAVYNYARGLERNGISYSAGDKSKSYFVLISGGDDPQSNGIRFWSDTAMFYSTLTKKYGVAKDHIKVYVSDGNSTSADANLASTGVDETPVLVDSPKDLDGDGYGDITGAATKSNVKACFDSLKSSLTANDQLFVFITSHGGPDGTEGPSNYESYAMLYDGTGNGNEWLDDNELAAYTSGFPCPVAFAIETCYAGGFIDDITVTAKRVIATACNHYESSFGYPGGDSWIDGAVGKMRGRNTWSGPFIAAFRGYDAMPFHGGGYPWEDYEYTVVNADSNGDGRISFSEAHAYAVANDSCACTKSSHPNWCSFEYDAYGNYYNTHEHPQYGESASGVGVSFFLLKQTGSITPVNDNFASAITISGVSGSQSGNNVGATMETSETKPIVQDQSTGSVWYKWTAPASGEVTFDTIGSSFDTVLGVYTGTVVSSLMEEKSDDDNGDSSAHTSKLTFPAVSGTTYMIAVYGYNGKTGSFSLNWEMKLSADNDYFSSATTISGVSGTLSGSNVDATMEMGEPLPSAQNNVGCSVWYKWTAPVSGPVTIDTIGSKFDTILGVYTGTSVSSLVEEVSDDDNGGDRTSKVSFQAVGGTVYWIAVYGYNGATGLFSLRWNLEVSSFTLTLDANGGTVSGQPSVSVQVEPGKNTNQAAGNRTVTRTGYTLVGWYDTAATSGGNMVLNAQGRAVNGVYWNGSYVPGVSSATWKYSGNVTAYARWTPNVSKYTVTFYGGGKTLGTATVELGRNTSQAAASAYKPTREGYVLTGWYDASGNIMFDAQGRAVNGTYWNGSYVKGSSSATWKYAGNVTAYANWAPAKYTVTFYGGGKTLGTATVEQGKNTNQAAASAHKPTREGYALTGWYDKDGNIMFDAQGRAANGKYWNGSYVPGTSSATWKYAGNVTAYANWTPIQKYTVTFYGGGKTLGTATVEKGKNTNQAAGSLYKPTRAGYVLTGWYDKDGKIMFDAQGFAQNGTYWNGTYVKGKSAATWKYAGNVTAYARWVQVAVTHVVIFYGSGATLGAAMVETGKNTNQAAASAYKPTRAGYVLSGWCDANGNIMFDAQGRAANGLYWNGSYVKGTSSATWIYDGNVTAYANWTPVSNSNAAVQKAPSVAVQKDDDELFAPGELTGTFADGKGLFALTLDEGLETAYLVTWTSDGGITRECEVTVADDTLVLTTEEGEIYRFAWEDGSLVATRVE